MWILWRPEAWQRGAMALAIALLAAYLLTRALVGLARLTLVRALGGDRTAALASPTVRRPVRILGLTVFLAIAAVLAFPALEIAGVPLEMGLRSRAVSGWLFESGLRVVLIGALAYLLLRIVAMVVSRFEHAISEGSGLDVLERAKRARTLGGLVQNVLGVAVLGVAVLMILRELRIDILPVLTGAGILGLAIGFGAQTLVRDIISGFFLILENQIRVGDVAVINGTGGLVEAINLRTVVLRDDHGTVHVFAAGAINTLANRTKDFSYSVIEVPVAHKYDPDQVIEILRHAGDELAADPAFRPSVLGRVEILGLEAMTEAHLTIKLRIKTVPLRQWEVGRELRRRIKKALDANHIDMPAAHVTVLQGTSPWVVKQ